MSQSSYRSKFIIKEKRQVPLPAPYVPPVRLRVWYFSPTGRCTHLNRELAETFSSTNLCDWRARPDLTQPSTLKNYRSQDDYTCIEVDFVHQYMSSNPKARRLPEDSLRDLFRLRFPSIIEDFFAEVFKQHMVRPLHVSMAPLAVGGVILPEDREKFTMMPQIWQRLEVEYTSDSRAGADPGRPGHNTALHAASVSMGARSILEYVKVIPDLLMRGDSMSNVFDDASGLSQRTINQLLEGESLGQTPEVREAWVKATVASAGFQELIDDIQSCAAEIERKKGPTNQELYRMVCQMASARKLFTVCQRATREFNVVVKGRTDANSNIALTALYYSVAVLVGSVILLASGPGVLAVGGVGLSAAMKIGGVIAGVGSAVQTGYTAKYKLELERKKIVFSGLDEMLPHLYESLWKAQVAFVAMFCQQVLGVPLESMTRDTRRRVLTELGVDTSRLSDKSYTNFLVLGAIKNMVKVYADFAAKRAEVASACGMQPDIRNAESLHVHVVGVGTRGMIEPSSPTVGVRA